MKWIVLFLVFFSGCSFRAESIDPAEPAPVVVTPVSESIEAVSIDDEQAPGQANTKSDDEDEDQEDEQAEEQDEPVVKKEKKQPVVKKTTKRNNQRRKTFKPAVLRVITNFDKADVTVNGMVYPEYVKPGETEGMVIPAGGPHLVRVTFDGKEKKYEIKLKPYETRLLFVELTGFGGASKPPPASPAISAKKEKKEEKKKKDDDKDDPGKITVYSKPAGTVMIDGKTMGERTPATLEVENGRHEVQVQYEGADLSEKKIVRVRNGSRIKLFFRERKK